MSNAEMSINEGDLVFVQNRIYFTRAQQAGPFENSLNSFLCRNELNVYFF